MSAWQGQKPIVPVPGITIMGVRPDFTKSGKQRFMIQCSDGKEYSTFDPQLASQAQTQWVGQSGTLLKEMNGQYENFGGFQPGVGGAAVPPAAAQGFPAQGGTPQFTPAANFVPAEDANKRSVVEMRRTVAVETAGGIVAAIAGTGFYLNDEGLDVEKIAADVLALSSQFGPYLAHGPAGAPVEAQGVVPALPPGVTPEQIQQWAQAQGAAVQVGAPVPAEGAPAEVPVADASPATSPY